MQALVAAVRLELPEADRHAAATVLAWLDGRGFLEVAPDQIAQDEGLPPEMVVRVLAVMRDVGPPGIGALSATDCLQRQAEALVAAGRAPALLSPVVAFHLPDVAEQRYSAIAAALATELHEVLEVVTILRNRLRPWVLWDGPNEAHHLPPAPDVFVDRDPADPNRLLVDVADATWFGLRAGRLSAPLRHDAAASSWARQLEHAARQFVAQLDARAGALRRVADVVVAAQHDFLLGDPAAHQPLTRTAVAQQTGLHLSTVSRAVDGKHLRLPDGRIMPFGSCFGTSAGARVAISEILAAEPHLTDAAMCARLEQRGTHVARRTVAKYRAELDRGPRRPS